MWHCYYWQLRLRTEKTPAVKSAYVSGDISVRIFADDDRIQWELKLWFHSLCPSDSPSLEGFMWQPKWQMGNRQHFPSDFLTYIPLWSSDQSSWLVIQRSGFDSRLYQIFLGSSESGTGSTQPREHNWGSRKTEKKTVGIRRTDYATPSIRNSGHLLHRQASVARSVQFACGLRPRSLVFTLFY
jgi:hypothetical protein